MRGASSRGAGDIERISANPPLNRSPAAAPQFRGERLEGHDRAASAEGRIQAGIVPFGATAAHTHAGGLPRRPIVNINLGDAHPAELAAD